MAIGLLYSMRQVWRAHIGNPVQTLETASQAFIRMYGTTAEFKHIGVDSDRGGRQYGPLVYHNELYAVFKPAVGMPLIPMTPHDLKNLAESLKYMSPDDENYNAVSDNLGAQLANAVRDMEGHRKTLEWCKGRQARERSERIQRRRAAEGLQAKLA